MKTLENQMRYYFYFFRLIGQFPFKITEKGLVPSSILKVYGIVPTATIIGVATFIGSSYFSNLGARDVILRFAFFSLGMSLLWTTVIVPIRRSSWYCIVFQRFRKVDECFHYIGNDIEWTKNTIPPLVILLKELSITGIVVGTEYAFPYWHGMRMPTYGMVFYSTIMAIMTTVTINCGTYAYLINTRFDAINQKLEKMANDCKSEKCFPVDKIFDSYFINHLYETNKAMEIFPIRENTTRRKKTKSIAANIRLLQKSHYELYGICSTLGDIFTLPIVLTVFFTGCEVLFTCYTGFGKIINDGVVDVFEVSTWLKYLVYDLFRILCICKAFTSIERSGNTTSYNVHGLILKTEDPEVQKELMSFSLQLLHQKINFSTCGFFRLDMSLLVSMTGAITTYLVILLQFTGKDTSDSGIVTSSDVFPLTEVADIIT